GALGLTLHRRGGCEALQEARDSPFVAQLLKNGHALCKKRLRAGVVALLANQGSQIRQASGNTPAIVHFTEHRKTFAVELGRLHRIPLIARYVSLMVEGARHPTPIMQFAKNGEAFLEKRLGLAVVSLRLYDISQIAERT